MLLSFRLRALAAAPIAVHPSPEGAEHEGAERRGACRIDNGAGAGKATLRENRQVGPLDRESDPPDRAPVARSSRARRAAIVRSRAHCAPVARSAPAAPVPALTSRQGLLVASRGNRVV
ncbi:MAG TPA: hypothetical protein VKB80_35955 [Kofleriaceae bacterium]|nr:hypothetical protein [Kofleriaceae bacterium]